MSASSASSMSTTVVWECLVKDGDGCVGPLWSQYPDYISSQLEAAYQNRQLPQIIHWGPWYHVDVPNMQQVSWGGIHREIRRCLVNPAASVEPAPSNAMVP